MNEKWYPEKVLVGSEGTPGTYNFIESVFHKEKHFAYAEFGFYRADTARNICERFPNCFLYLFDFLRMLILRRRNCQFLITRFITTETLRITTTLTTGV